MNKVQFATAIATAALLVGSAAPAMAATTVTVAGNGALSNNHVTVKNSNTKVVSQTNSQTVKNVVNSNANTGKNNSSFNTGGVSVVSTGPATSTVTVTNGGNSNVATLSSDCGCVAGTTVTVAGNGAFSHNGVKVSNSNWVGAFQTNVSNVVNVVSGNASSGGNNSNFNTGGGSVVKTGAATSTVNVTTEGSSNTLNQ